MYQFLRERIKKFDRESKISSMKEFHKSDYEEIVECLTDEERLLLYRRFFGGYYNREQADIIGVTKTTIINRYNRIIKKLRNFSK